MQKRFVILFSPFHCLLWQANGGFMTLAISLCDYLFSISLWGLSRTQVLS